MSIHFLGLPYYGRVIKTKASYLLFKALVWKSSLQMRVLNQSSFFFLYWQVYHWRTILQSSQNLISAFNAFHETFDYRTLKNLTCFPYSLFGFPNFLLFLTRKNGFVTATKLGTTNKILVAATKNFAAATKRFVDRTKHFVVTKKFCYPYFNKWFCQYEKTFFPVNG